ncbi:MAG: 16S rRNA (guanine(527)-N(7))-methyltransferase RsmG [Burkholderiales bacterium]|nr:16S rRNA (guanine(527)-N(7))-methyltransferase RsmG [Burkholderiales bacterium]
MSLEARLDAGLAELSLGLQASQRERLLTYIGLLERWNRVYNLTAVRDPARMVSQHLLDSLAILPHLGGGALLDVGSGAGLPGIPIAIATPERAVTLLDSNQKKVAFLQQAVAELRLTNATVCRERVEAWQTKLRFDVIVSRAFAELADFVIAAAHLLAKGGVLAAMKGVYPDEEIARLPSGFRIRAAIRIAVPGLAAARHLVLVEPIAA